MEKMPNEKNQSAETIVSAAIEYEGEIYTGVNHAEAFEKIKARFPDVDPKAKNFTEDGFTTSSGRFVDRVEAEKIADAAEQLTVEAKRHEDSGVLHSEDIEIKE